MARFSKNAKIVHKISRSCDIRPSYLRNDYRSPEIHLQVVPLRDVLFPFLLLESIQSFSLGCTLRTRSQPQTFTLFS